MSSWIAAATAYSTTGVNMIPFYIYYSMFGFQRIGDLAWAAGDMQAKGFMIGGTAGRTTLAGEGLQHQDGHSLLQAAMIPNCRAYDPTFAYEMAVIIHSGMKKMYCEQQNVFYYFTAMNENYSHPAMPEGAEEGIIKGLYLFSKGNHKKKLRVNLMGSGAIFREVIAAAELLEKDFNVAADIWGAPSFNELRRDAVDCTRWNILHPEAEPKVPYISEVLTDNSAPYIAATDFIRSYPDQVREWIPGNYTVLGTDGYGRSDTRVALRRHFEVNRYYVAVAALKALADQDKIPASKVSEAIAKYEIDADRGNPINL